MLHHQKRVTFDERPKAACIAVTRPMPQNNGQNIGVRNVTQNLPSTGKNLPHLPQQHQQNQSQQTQTMMSQHNFTEQLNSRMVQQSQNRSCNDILAAKPQT